MGRLICAETEVEVMAFMSGNGYSRRRRRKRKYIALRILQITIMLAVLSASGTFVWKYVNDNYIEDSLSGTDDPLTQSYDVYNSETESSSEKIADTVGSNVYKAHTYESSDVQNKLRQLALNSEEFKKIYDNMALYPEDLIEALCNNVELLDYVKGYLEASGRVEGGLTKNELKEDYPLLMQWDKRWGYVDYGDSKIGLSGCGPTCLSMVAVALTGNSNVTPDAVAEYAQQNGYYLENTGTTWSLMTEGCRHFGITGKEICLDENVIINQLNAGHPIICSMGPGDFTQKGHFIVLVGIEDSKIIVNDPNSRERSNKLWDYSTLSGQIKNLWAFS